MPRKTMTKPEDVVASEEVEVSATLPEVKTETEIEPRESEAFGSSTRGKGVLEVMSEGYGFLRANGLSAGPGDIYISQSQIRRFDIRAGDTVEGLVRPPKDTERYFGMLKVEKINSVTPEEAMRRPKFETLTAVYPNKQLKLETG